MLYYSISYNHVILYYHVILIYIILYYHIMLYYSVLYYQMLCYITVHKWLYVIFQCMLYYSIILAFVMYVMLYNKMFSVVSRRSLIIYMEPEWSLQGCTDNLMLHCSVLYYRVILCYFTLHYITLQYFILLLLWHVMSLSAFCSTM